MPAPCRAIRESHRSAARAIRYSRVSLAAAIRTQAFYSCPAGMGNPRVAPAKDVGIGSYTWGVTRFKLKPITMRRNLLKITRI